MPLDPNTTAVVPPLPDTKKESRGFNHVMCGKLIAPRTALAEIGDDDTACVGWPHTQDLL